MFGAGKNNRKCIKAAEASNYETKYKQRAAEKAARFHVISRCLIH
jgi:hypothetical protein